MDLATYNATTKPYKYRGFTHEELEKAFNLVKNKEHWKNPILSYCNSEEIKLIGAAIIFYTATHPEFKYVSELEHDSDRFKAGDFIFKVVAIGYRAGPAGDH